MELLLHGGKMGSWEVSSLPSMDDQLDAALNTEACSILLTEETVWVTPEQDYENCMASNFGAYSRSYHSVVMKLTDLALTIAHDIPLDTNLTAMELLMTTNFLQNLGKFSSFENPYFRNVSSELNHLVVHNMHTGLASSMDTIRTISVTFVVLFTAFTVTIYMPLIRASGRHVAATQAILLMFDDKQLSEIAPLKAAVKAMLLQTQSMKSGRFGSRVAVLELLFLCFSCLRRKCGCRRRRKSTSVHKPSVSLVISTDQGASNPSLPVPKPSTAEGPRRSSLRGGRASVSSDDRIAETIVQPVSSSDLVSLTGPPPATGTTEQFAAPSIAANQAGSGSDEEKALSSQDDAGSDGTSHRSQSPVDSLRRRNPVMHRRSTQATAGSAAHSQ
jgi:hypothetical protein